MASTPIPVVEHDIPIPESNPKQGRAQKQESCRKYPFVEMSVGDSFLLPIDGSVQKTMAHLTSASYKYGLRHGMKFTSRVQDDGIRCWRIK